MPDGSSSDAPVINPGPRLFRKSFSAKALRGSPLDSDLRSSAFTDVLERVFFLLAMPGPLPPQQRSQGAALVRARTERSVTARGRDRVHAIVAEHMRHEPWRLKYFPERGVANVQAPGIGPERRHHRARAIADETAPLQRAAPGGNARLWMEMTGNFAGRAGWLVAKHDSTDRHLAGDHTAEVARQRGIVVAGDPDPVAPRLQCSDGFAIRRRQPLMRLAVMKAVAERDHATWIVARNHRR